MGVAARALAGEYRRAIGFLVMLPVLVVDPEALRAARLRAHLTQHEVARRIGVAGGERVSRWELGTSEPRAAVLRRLADALEVDVDELLEVAPGAVVDLRWLRLRAGLSVRELAEMTDMSVASLKRWENGRIERTPSETAIEPVADALGVSLRTLHEALVASRAAARR